MAWAPMVSTHDGSNSNSLIPDSLNSDSLDPQWLDLRQLSPAALNRIVAGHPPMALSRKPRNPSLEAQA